MWLGSAWCDFHVCICLLKLDVSGVKHTTLRWTPHWLALTIRRNDHCCKAKVCKLWLFRGLKAKNSPNTYTAHCNHTWQCHDQRGSPRFWVCRDLEILKWDYGRLMSSLVRPCRSQLCRLPLSSGIYLFSEQHYLPTHTQGKYWTIRRGLWNYRWP